MDGIRSTRGEITNALEILLRNFIGRNHLLRLGEVEEGVKHDFRETSSEF
jgi:hypothetical protein